MARLDDRRTENVPGDVYVDTSCIDCDTCRWMAPEVFDRAGDMSRVHRQPRTDAELRRALQALVACPTASIGTTGKHAMGEVLASFPIPVDGPVYHCGYHDESSFGATTYLVVREAGNVLVDSPRFSKPLVRRLEELGGVDTLFLTHRDDVGDHARFREHFGCERVLHRDDARGELLEVERLLEGTEPVALAADLLAIPVPGHTRGSTCLLHGDYLFTGDHLAWSGRIDRVHAFRTACWYDWNVQIDSMARLAEHRFEWILPGHARRCHFPADEMHARVLDTVAWMRSVA